MNNRGKPVSKKVPLLTELRTKKEVYLMILPFSLFFIVFRSDELYGLQCNTIAGVCGTG